MTPAITPRPILVPDPTDIDPLFPLPPPLLTETVARESKPCKHRKSKDATFCDRPTTSALQIKIDEHLL